MLCDIGKLNPQICHLLWANLDTVGAHRLRNVHPSSGLMILLAQKNGTSRRAACHGMGNVCGTECFRELAEADHAVQEVEPRHRCLVFSPHLWYIDHLHVVDAQIADLSDIRHDLKG